MSAYNFILMWTNCTAAKMLFGFWFRQRHFLQMGLLPFSSLGLASRTKISLRGLPTSTAGTLVADKADVSNANKTNHNVTALKTILGVHIAIRQYNLQNPVQKL